MRFSVKMLFFVSCPKRNFVLGGEGVAEIEIQFVNGNRSLCAAVLCFCSANVFFFFFPSFLPLSVDTFFVSNFAAFKWHLFRFSCYIDTAVSLVRQFRFGENLKCLRRIGAVGVGFSDLVFLYIW